MPWVRLLVAAAESATIEDEQDIAVVMATMEAMACGLVATESECF